MSQAYAERLASLKKQKQNKTTIKEVVKVLAQLLAEADTESAFVGYIMDFHCSAGEQIFKKEYASAWSDKLPAIVAALCSNARFKKNSANCAWVRVCAIVKSFVQDGQDCTIIMKLFDRSLTIVSDINGVSQNTMDVFRDKVLKIIGTEFFLYAACPTGNAAVKTMDSFIVNLLDAGYVTQDDPNIISWYHNHGRELRWKPAQNAPVSEVEVVEEVVLPEPTVEPIEEPIVELPQENVQLQTTLEKAHELATNLNALLCEPYGALAQLTQTITQKEQEIAYLTVQLQERTQQLKDLQQHHIVQESDQVTQATCVRNELQKLQEELAQMERTNQDLNERLAVSLHMDGIAQNQELITLKANIKKNLQLEYDDFLASAHAPFNEDEFIANRATIARIFRGLKRLGISFEGEDLS